MGAHRTDCDCPCCVSCGSCAAPGVASFLVQIPDVCVPFGCTSSAPTCTLPAGTYQVAKAGQPPIACPGGYTEPPHWWIGQQTCWYSGSFTAKASNGLSGCRAEVHFIFIPNGNANLLVRIFNSVNAELVIWTGTVPTFGGQVRCTEITTLSLSFSRFWLSTTGGFCNDNGPFSHPSFNLGAAIVYAPGRCGCPGLCGQDAAGNQRDAPFADFPGSSLPVLCSTASGQLSALGLPPSTLLPFPTDPCDFTYDGFSTEGTSGGRSSSEWHYRLTTANGTLTFTAFINFTSTSGNCHGGGTWTCPYTVPVCGKSYTLTSAPVTGPQGQNLTPAPIQIHF